MLVDNKVLYHAWLREGCRNQGVNSVLKQIFETTLRLNIALHLDWVPSALNPADQPSREWSDADVILAPNFWERVEALAGPHSIDLMALDSNSQCHRHYTPHPTPLSTGVNFFAHNPRLDEQGRRKTVTYSPLYILLALKFNICYPQRRR